MNIDYNDATAEITLENETLKIYNITGIDLEENMLIIWYGKDNNFLINQNKIISIDIQEKVI